MGAEADIGLSRVNDGHVYLNEIRKSRRTPRHFTIDKPSGFVPIYICQYHDVETAEASLINKDGNPISLGCFDDIVRLNDIWAVGIFHRRQPESLTEIALKYQTPGGVNREQMLSAWEKITPGIWVITSYIESGTHNETCDRYDYPQLTLSEEVRWEFWT